MVVVCPIRFEGRFDPIRGTRSQSQSHLVHTQNNQQPTGGLGPGVLRQGEGRLRRLPQGPLNNALGPSAMIERGRRVLLCCVCRGVFWLDSMYHPPVPWPPPPVAFGSGGRRCVMHGHNLGGGGDVLGQSFPPLPLPFACGRHMTRGEREQRGGRRPRACACVS